MAHKLFLKTKNELLLLPDNKIYSPEISFLKESFEKKGTLALLDLLDLRIESYQEQDLIFWQKFSSQIFRDFCHSNTLETNNIINSKAIETLLLKSYPSTNHELLTLENLTKIAFIILNHLKEKSLLFPSTKEFLRQEFPKWSDVAQIFFHLAENPKAQQNNFVFLASYTTRYSSQTGLQHITFEKALFDQLKDKDQNKVEKLLEPIQKASKKSLFLRELLAGAKLFGPAFFSREETFAFLEDCSIFEEAGIFVKFPRSWNQTKPSHAKVQITLDDSNDESLIGFHALFKFKAQVTIDNEVLTQEELEEILKGSNSLIQIRGKWIQIHQKKIKAILSEWQKASLLQQKGLGFIEAMRLISHYKSEKKGKEQEDKNFLEISTPQSLRNFLEKLKNPKAIQNKDLESLQKTDFKAKLRLYQEEGFKWLCFLKDRSLGGILADDMGLGKTIQIIALLVREKEKYFKQTNLLIVPASLLGNWQNEIKKFAPTLKTKILHRAFSENQNFKDETFILTNCDVLLTSYKMACKTPWIFEKDWNLLVIDEAQAIKSPETNLSKQIKKIKASCKIALTGTPIENNLIDLWSLFDFCLPSLLGPFPWFKKFYTEMTENSSFEPLKKIIKPYLLRRVKTDQKIIKDLPKKIEKKTYCTLTKEQAECYKDELKNLSKALKNEEGDFKRKGLVLKYLMVFKQICNHPAQHLGDKNYHESRSGKFLILAELAKKISLKGEKLLVFTQFKELTDALHQVLSNVFGEKGLILHGGTPVEKRKEFVEIFQSSSKYPFFILSLKAGGSGLNLTRANHVIHFDRWWNPSVENQATDRSYRIGQKSNVIVHKLICSGTLEQKIDQIIEQKINLIDSVVSSSQLNITELSDEKLLEFLSLDSSAGDMIDINQITPEGPHYAL